MIPALVALTLTLGATWTSTGTPWSTGSVNSTQQQPAQVTVPQPSTRTGNSSQPSEHNETSSPDEAWKTALIAGVGALLIWGAMAKADQRKKEGRR